MKRIVLLLGVLLLAVLAGCGRGPAPSADLPAGTPAPVDLAELARDPAAYEGQWVRVGGQYGVLPLPLCDGVLNLSPATWALSEGGVVLRASGLEGVLYRLASDGLQLTVEGQWQRWEGPIGCGRSVVPSVVWYLRVRQVLAPNPLVAATLTPRDFAGQPVGGMITPGATAPPAEVPAVGAPTARPLPTATDLPSPLATPTDFRSPLATPTPTTSFPPSPTPVGLLSPIASPTLTPTDPFSPIASPTATPLPTYTPDGAASPIPTSSPSPTPGGTSNQGEIETGQVLNRVLAPGERHRWTHYGQVGDHIHILVGPATGIDTEITVNNPQGTRILTLNSGGAGQMDMVEDLELTQTGSYQIIIRDVDGDSGAYALAVTAVGDVTIVFPGNLNYGDNVARSLPADTYHIWHFQATAGDQVTIVVAPQDEIDIEFDLYRPAMGDPLRHVDANGPGDPEELTIRLDETGFYSILIQEYTGHPGSYALSLTRG